MKVRVRKATMTNKERMEALLRREKPDRVPWWGNSAGGFAALYCGGSIADDYTWPLKRAYEVEKKACHDFDWVFVPALRARSTRGLFGGETALPISKYAQGVFVTKFAAETAEEVMALKVPDVRVLCSPERIDFYKRMCQEDAEIIPFVTCESGGVANTSAGIVGCDNWCKWMIQKPEVAHRLFRLAADYSIAMAQYVKDTFGVDRVIPYGSSASATNQLISPKHVEQFVLPYEKEVHQKQLALGFKHHRLHLNGEHTLNLPYWQQVPLGDPGIVSVSNENDLETVAKFFPDDIIQGNLDATLIQIGTPEEIYEAAGKVIEQGKSLANGYIFRLASAIPPYASIENVRAITRALNDFGWYD